jgi:hypothetical protein
MTTNARLPFPGPIPAAVLLAALAAAPAARAGSLSIEGGAVVLGRTESSQVVIRVDEPPGAEVVPLRLSVNVGRFTEPVRFGPGRYRAAYQPPATRFPQVALVAIWRETGADAPIEFLRIPLFGATRVPVTASPGATVTVQAGVGTFGPVVLDRRGRAEVPIIVEPGVRDCTVHVREKGGAESTKRVPVEVPPYNRLTAALVPHAVVADGRSPVRLDVFYDLGGAGVPPERIRVAPSIGAVAFQRASRGLYSYRYVAPPDTAAEQVTFAVTVAGDPEARASAELALGLPPPAHLVVTPPAERLRAGSGATARVSVLALDAAGMGLPALEVSATANGQPLPPPTYRGGGLYDFTFTAPAAWPPGGLVQFRAAASGKGKSVEGAGNWQLEAAPAAKSVLARLTPDTVPADGRTEARLQLEARDASGAPVEHAQLLVVASHGSVGTLQERGNGVYEAAYLPPDGLPGGDSTFRVVDGSGGFEQAYPLPLRTASRRLLVGLGGGWSAAAGSGSGARVVADLWVPFQAGPARLAAGLSSGWGTASRTVTDASGTLSSRTDATVVPLSLRLGWEAWARRRLSLTLGAGAAFPWASFESSLAGGSEQGFGIGALGFASLGWALGPGQAWLELSYGTAVVETADYRIDASGLTTSLGYRLGLF